MPHVPYTLTIQPRDAVRNDMQIESRTLVCSVETDDIAPPCRLTFTKYQNATEYELHFKAPIRNKDGGTLELAGARLKAGYGVTDNCTVTIHQVAIDGRLLLINGMPANGGFICQTESTFIVEDGVVTGVLRLKMPDGADTFHLQYNIGNAPHIAANVYAINEVSKDAS